MIIPMVYMMIKNISQFKSIQELVIQLNKEILFHCEKRFGSVESVELLSIATILDPRLKRFILKINQHFISDEIKQNQDLCGSSSDNDKQQVWKLQEIKCKKKLYYIIICIYLFCFRT